jgi:CRP/FNR family transcriptional regulator
MIDLKIANRIEDIQKIAIFAQLKNDQLLTILKDAKIIKLKKDQILFSQEQKVENFYIVLDGLVKLLRLNSKGSEAIIKIIDKGSLSDIFSDNFSLSAMAIKNTNLLTIPKDIFKNYAEKNHNLMHNILMEISTQNDELVNQLSNLKIDDNKEKIGQFLLKNSLKKGKKNSEIDLEFSKSEIASYLGMRLETFSRILHQLKIEEKFSVKKNKIISTQENTLCTYYNKEISANCDMKNSNFCSQKN